jgi:TRAP-type uncharacterized transport system substrate-binding protein
MITRRTLRRIVWLRVAPVVGVSALVVALYFYWHAPHERNYQLRITAGDSFGTRNEIAQILRRRAEAQNITLDIQGMAGSEAALDAVNAGTLDAALVQGGLHIENRPNVRQVATLQIEPLHLLVKQELAEAAANHLRELEGKTINLSEIGSGTHSIAEDVLQFAGLRKQAPGWPQGYVPTTMSHSELVAERDRAQLPDAVFIVSPLPSETVKILVNRHDYRLVPIAFGEAFALDALTATDLPDGKSRHGHVAKSRVVATTIPAFTYQVEPPVPAAPVPALGTRLLLVAHRDVNPHAVRRLVEVVYLSEFANVMRPPLDTKLLDLPPEFEWHAGTRDYLHRNTPIVSGTVMDAAHKGFAIFAAAASGLFVLWQWRQMRVQFLGGLNGYIGDIARIEEQVRQIERDHMGGHQQLLELRDELSRLKTEALDRLTRGELSDRELLPAFLVQCNDVRDHVNRLIERCNGVPQTTEAGVPLPR